MIATLVASVGAFVATGFDEIVMLTVIFAKMKTPRNVRDVYIGQEISMIVLLAISLLAAFGVAFIPREWVGLLGLVPIAIGLKVAITGEDDDDEADEDEVAKRLTRHSSLVVAVALIAIGGGAEELSVYIPFFSSLLGANLVAAVVTFLILVPVWCALCQRISRIPRIGETIEKYGRVVISVLFVAIGIFVLVENQTVPALLSLFG